ncbi:alpha/beta fold hydrolase [Salisediminibacterium halotolerans]|uniref:alpha/beta fold hydrolase n=1 Tax=Salisediminibacterium halotolerans TaxID=517425 RepID=UPI000EAE45E6|nr:alpha/beta hydrolase [Salisediminibacterium halotolerans]RLJ72253.1 pimeloyl-ACP methyl ester carboxylesterase [Actinophytocola xinjiangensis]RPE85467.1 pimeloyl-ACP methyl ester carboxylesterase [Salisediminibacterium halotolerans]TWG33422.1 pimeloyl-ACP methyl ester carboxylesterase [Salisediminibacterium halotolerans]GEL09258.1 alpha/beta hydrolase [Salisediminibacterium halotolerans]
MKKVFKWSLIVIPLLVIAAAAFVVGGSYFEHRDAVAEEKEAYPAPGELVDVYNDGHTMHVYSEGDGEETIVFLAGFGTPSPVYDFQTLTNELKDDYRTVIVERYGYGWSDVSDHDRDIEAVVDETRTALLEAGEEGPFVIAGHSMGSIEAIHWAQSYPEEVNGVIGLDPLVPSYYEEKGEAPSMSNVTTFLARSGLMRQQPEVFDENFHAMEKGLLTEADAEVARTLFLRRVQTTNMANEAEKLTENVETVSGTGLPETPFYAAIASENEDGASFIQSFAEDAGGKSEVFDGGHYIHLDQPEAIAEKIQEWVSETQ